MKGLSTEEYNTLIPNDTFLLGYVGSISHGTNSESEDGIDDKDVMGVCFSRENYLGSSQFEQKETKYYEYDVVVYEFKKFLGLLKKLNPNVLSLLWLKPNFYLHKDFVGGLLVENRNLFVSKLAYYSYGGYARAQQARMLKGDRKDLNSLYVIKQRIDDEIKSRILINTTTSTDREKWLFRDLTKVDVSLLSEWDLFSLSNYVDKKIFKHGSHLIRLLNMGIEFLTTGELNVFRHDAQKLISIKRGDWTVEQIKEEATKLFTLMDEAFVRSNLPKEPNYSEIDKLQRKIMVEYLREVICA